MAEDPPSREILQQILERLDLLERVLQGHTSRLHLMEQQLGLARPQQPLSEPLLGQNGETDPATSQVKTQEVKTSEVTQPTRVAPQPLEPPEQTWSPPETQRPRTTETHSWMNGASDASRTYAPREAAAPSPLRAQVEKAAAANEASPARAVREEKRRDLESLIGGRWFNWIGIIAVT